MARSTNAEQSRTPVSTVKQVLDSSMLAISIREFLERVIEERDRLYDTRFRAGEIAVNAALAAQERAVNAAFVASEKAIIKAEEAQREYNVRSNEFRGQLDDQAKTLMTRSESLVTYTAMNDKLDALRIFFESKLEAQRLSVEKSTEIVSKDLASLRESRSEHIGVQTSSRELISYLIAAVGLVAAFASTFWKR